VLESLLKSGQVPGSVCSWVRGSVCSWVRGSVGVARGLLRHFGLLDYDVLRDSAVFILHTTIVIIHISTRTAERGRIIVIR